MTFREEVREMLFKNGMLEGQINAVVETMIADHEEMETRWDDDVEGYPDKMLNLVLLSARDYALEYIKENCPQAWFRPAFE